MIKIELDYDMPKAAFDLTLRYIEDLRDIRYGSGVQPELFEKQVDKPVREEYKEVDEPVEDNTNSDEQSNTLIDNMKQFVEPVSDDSTEISEDYEPTFKVPSAPAPVPEVPPAPEVPEEAKDDGLDADGVPWDERIHAGSKGKKKDGRWKRKPGVPDAEYNNIYAQLTGTQVEGGTVHTYASMTNRVSELVGEGSISIDVVQQVVREVGLQQFVDFEKADPQTINNFVEILESRVGE